MRKTAVLLCAILGMCGCQAPVNIPLPKDHPAYGFYQTANAFNVSGNSCLKIKGSLEIRPDKIGTDQDYQKARELAPGLFVVRQLSTGKEWITVLFMEYGLAASIPKTCSWDIAEYPIEMKS